MRALSADRSETKTPLREELQRLFLWEGRWTDAEETEEAVCLSGLSQSYGREILP